MAKLSKCYIKKYENKLFLLYTFLDLSSQLQRQGRGQCAIPSYELFPKR